MADKRLIDFVPKNLPTGDDIIYLGNVADSFRESRTTLNQERSYTPQYVREASEDVTQLYMGKNVINGSASPITVTIPQGAAFPITSQFNMIRNGTGAFTLAAAAGVTLNGVDGGSVTLAQQYDRLVSTEILPDEWTYIEYSGSDLPPPILPAYGEMFFQGNGTATTIAAQSTPVKVAGTYVAGETQDFTHVAGTLTYTGAETRVFSVDVSTTVSLNLNTANITVLVAKNGAVIEQSGQSPDLDGVSPSFVPLSLNKLVSLSTNDTIEVWTQNNSVNNEDITHQDLNVTVGAPGITGGSLTSSGIPGISLFSHDGFAFSPIVSTRFYQKIGNIVCVNLKIASMRKAAAAPQTMIEIEVPFTPMFTTTVQAEGNGTVVLFNSLLPGDTSIVSNVSSVIGQSRIRIDFFVEKEAPIDVYKSSLTIYYQIQ